MDLFGPGPPTMAILLFFLIFPLGIVAVVDRPNWNEAEWEIELESFGKKYVKRVKEEGFYQIPKLIECVLNVPKDSRPCSDTTRTLIVNEIFIRKKFKDLNEDCNSGETKETDILQNPLTRQNQKDYPSWQEKLINSKLKYCDPHKYLRCSAGGKCVCLPGSIQVGNVCLYSHGSPCTLFYSFDERYFDPFSSKDEDHDFSSVFGPECMNKSDVCFGTFQNLYHRDESYCVERGTFSRGPRSKSKVFNYLERLLPITFNEKCNSTDHNQLYTSTEEEDANQDVRIKTLEDFQIRGVKFCDLEEFLTCGPSEKCECMSPSSREGDKCAIPIRLDKCSTNIEMEPILMNKTLVPKAQEKLMIGFANSVGGCEGNLTCQTNMMEMYCTCPPGTTGLECNEALTRFLSIVRAPSLPADVAEYPEKFMIFSVFNKVAVKFEKVFQREEGSFCVAQIQIEAEILVGEILKLKYPGTTMTKRQYDDLSKKIQNFRIPHTGRIICNETLRCQPTTKSCVRVTRRDYLQDLVKTLEKFKSRKCAQPSCSEFPKDFDDVIFDGSVTLFYGGEHEMKYIRIIEQLSKLLKKCDCRNKRVENMSMSQSLNHFILLVSVVTFFLATNF